MARKLLPACLVAAVFAAFFPALSAGFVLWDDDKNFLENAGWRGLSLEHLRWMATTFHGGPYQPLSWFSLALEHAAWGMRPAAFHATNVALHAAGTVAFFFLARKVFAIAVPAIAGSAREFAAFAAALFFGVHPLRVESVAWITERRDVLSGVFYVLALLAYVHAATAEPGRRRRVLLGASLAAFVLGLLAKASGMTLPLALVVFDVWILRRPLRDAIVGKIPFLIPAAVFGVVAYFGQASLARELRTVGEHGVLQRVAQAAFAATFYAGRTLLPIRLSPIYELPTPLDPFEPRFVVAMILAACATALAFSLRRQHPAGWTAWAAFLLIVAPVSGLVQAGPQLVADRYTYLACMPFAHLVAGALFVLAPRAAPVLAFVAAAALAVCTFRQAALWQDTETLFTHALAVDPRSAIAHDVVGRALAMRGRRDEAAEHYRRAIELHPDRPIPHNNLGLLLLQEGRTDEAIAEFRESLRVQDDYARGRTNLGAALLRRGDAAEAESVLREALRRDPRDAGARTNLAQALLAQGRVDAAVGELEAVLATNPRLAEAHEGLAQAYARLGRADLAAEHRRAAQALRRAQ